MKASLVVLRRELRAWFDSPTGYVVAIGFLALTSSLFVLDLWIVDQASMRSFFDWLSWTACFLIPAITMRSWAEERRGATYELLLTLPMRSIELVVGKFLGALVFYLFVLAGSLVVPILLATLTSEGVGLDWGRIAAGYLGTVLAGAMLIAIGVFVSNLCRDQVVAFIVTLVVVLGLKLLGFAPIAAQLDSVAEGLGTFLRENVSWSEPLSRFVRGLVDFGDVLFFLAWTGAFLFLNGVGLESRARPRTRTTHAVAVALGVALAVLLGSLLLPLGPRLDWTADRLYTLSPAAESVLDELDPERPVRVKLYFSPKDEMPAAMATLERDIVEALEELERVADGALRVEVVHLHADDAILRAVQEARTAQLGEEAAEDESERGEVETELLQEGVVPFRVRSGGITGTETKVVYAAMTITHGAQPKEIIPQLMPGALATLERDVVTRVHRLVAGERPVVGLLAPIESMDVPPQQLQILSQLGLSPEQLMREQDDYRTVAAMLARNDKYDVRRLHPEPDAVLPDDLDTLVIVRPESLPATLATQARDLLARGGSVVVAAQTYDAQLRPTRGGAAVQLQPIETGLAPLLEPLGITVPQEMLLARESFPLTYSMGFGPPVTVDFRWTFRLDTSNATSELPFVDELGSFLLVDAAAPVEIDRAVLDDLGLEASVVLTTDEDAWTREVPQASIPRDLNDEQPGEGPIPLAVLVRGTFPDTEAEGDPTGSNASVDEDDESEDGDEDGAGGAAAATGSGLLVMGSATSLHDARIASPEGGLSWEASLLSGAVDALSLDEVLLGLRVKTPTSRPIRDIERAEILLYQLLFVGLAPLIFLAAGLGRLIARKRKQERPWRPAERDAAAAGGES